jgi:hypothetical protein
MTPQPKAVATVSTNKWTRSITPQPKTSVGSSNENTEVTAENQQVGRKHVFLNNGTHHSSAATNVVTKPTSSINHPSTGMATFVPPKKEESLVAPLSTQRNRRDERILSERNYSLNDDLSTRHDLPPTKESHEHEEDQAKSNPLVAQNINWNRNRVSSDQSVFSPSSMPSVRVKRTVSSLEPSAPSLTTRNSFDGHESQVSKLVETTETNSLTARIALFDKGKKI